MASPGGYQGIILPNTQPAFGQVQQQGIELQQRNMQQTAALYERELEKQRDENYRKTKLLQDEFDHKQYVTPDDKANKVIDENLQKAESDILDQAPKLNYNDLYALAQSKLAPIIGVKDAITARLTNEQKKVETAQKQFPEFDYLRMSNDLGDNIVNDFFKQNKDGSYDILPSAAYGNTGTLANLMSDDTGKYIKNFDPLYNYISGSYDAKNGGQQVAATAQTDHAGVRQLTQYKGQHSPFYTLNGTPDESGFLPHNQIPQLKLVTEDLPIKDANGNHVQAIPKDLYDQTIGSDPVRDKMVRTLWAQQRPPNIQKGSAEDDMLMRHWLTTVIPQHDPSYISPIDKQTNANVLTKIQLGLPASGTQKEAPVINDVYNEIEQKSSGKPHGLPVNELSGTAQSEVLKYARDIVGNVPDENDPTKTRNLTQSDIVITHDANGNYFLVRAYNKKYVHNPDGTPRDIIAPLDFKSINLPANKGVKGQQEVLKNTPKPKFVGIPEGGF